MYEAHVNITMKQNMYELHKYYMVLYEPFVSDI
jgi:hypothetical protein